MAGPVICRGHSLCAAPWHGKDRLLHLSRGNKKEPTTVNRHAMLRASYTFKMLGKMGSAVNSVQREHKRRYALCVAKYGVKRISAELT